MPLQCWQTPAIYRQCLEHSKQYVLTVDLHNYTQKLNVYYVHVTCLSS